MLAARIGPGLLPTLTLVIRSLSRPPAQLPIPTHPLPTVIAFVASVPGKDRRSLAFSRWPGGAVLKWL